MTQDFLEYPKLVEHAMRGVVKSALIVAAENGLPGLHHFYITFRTRDPDVKITDRLLAQYPTEITIVLENQYWDLEVEDDKFSVTLKFSGAHENLVVPYSAITSFVDPSVKFGLQFGNAEGTATESPDTTQPAEAKDADTPDAPDDKPADARTDATKTDDGSGDAQVVALDSFRKK